MDTTTAQRIVRDTFKAPFDRKRYRDFINEVCNGFDESTAQNMGVPDAFSPHVKSCQRLGTFESGEGELADVLIVQLTESYKLERTRTALRAFVAHGLKLKRGEDYKEAGLVAFVAPDSQSWRFSYVRMEYGHKRDPNTGKIKPEEHLTPARRYSYLVGADEQCHTAQTRFLNLLQNTSETPTLAQIEEAFSVESVTKEFFREYARLFEDTAAALGTVAKRNKTIRDDFKAKSVSMADFSKKLLGQIVFLYFIQKKGWLGVAKDGKWGDGPRNFMRLLVDRAVRKNKCVFTSVLEPLFYNTLSTDRGHEAWCKTFQCRIPFLNGGLFEPLAGYEWEKAEIDLPNALFTNKQLSPAGDVGAGILDVFDRYNFTVNEAEPLEKEVAIDPEMLGKVFENLIKENLRKGLGSYYTPREIVHYMCQEGLINYLDAAINFRGENTALENHKQGKFETKRPEQKSSALPTRQEVVPRADLETLVHLGDHPIKMPKSIEQQARLIDEKLAYITVCDPAVGSGAFPVGMMTEIVRARSALTPYFNDVENDVEERTPYRFKRHAIQNCLYGVDIDPGAVEIAKLRLWLSLVVDEEHVRQIKPLPNLDFKIVPGNSLIGLPFKSQRLSEIEGLKARFFEETDHDKKAALKVDIDRKLADCFASSKRSLGYEVNFDFGVYFSEVFQTRGGFDVVIANPPYIDSEAMTKDTPELRQLIQSSYSLTKGNWDIYIAFYEKGFALLGAHGVISFITPDKWISKPFGDQLRLKMTDKLFSILKAGRSVFESVKVDAIVTLFLNWPEPFLRVFSYVGTQIDLKRTIAKDALTPPYAYDWVFSDFVELLAKVAAHSKNLSDYGLCENACATSDAYKLKEFIEEEPKKANGADYLRIINTGTIGKFFSRWGRRQMVYLGDRYLRPVVHKQEFLAAFRNTYGQKAVKPKLIVKGLNLLDACLDSDGTTIPGKTTLIVTASNLETLKFLAAILNSSVPFFYLKEKYPASSYNQGTTFTKDMINALPIPETKPNERAKLISCVDRIIVAKQRDGEADVSVLEGEIDRLVYELYDLTSQEIQIMEGAVN